MGNRNTKCTGCGINDDRTLMTPGCCGNPYHQACILTLGQQGLCPSCFSQLPNDIINLQGTQAIPVVAEQLLPIVQAVPNDITPGPPLPPPPSYGNRRGRVFTPITPINLPEDYVTTWTPPPDNDLSDAQMSVILTGVPEVPEISTGARLKFNNVVTLASVESASCPDPQEQDDMKMKMDSEMDATVSDRAPMDIVCILDVSGSMSCSNKLDNLKEAVDYVREELSENDRMSVITFNNSAVVVHNLLRMTDAKKDLTKATVDNIYASGGTKILSGLKLADNILSRRSSSNPISSVFLLTDGIDSSDMRQKKIIAKKLKEAGISLFVYGFGRDHDSAHLKAIADAGEGTFTFIEESNMVVDAFGGALGAEKSIFATNVVLSITASSPGVVITGAFSGAYKNSLSVDGSKVDVFLRNLMQGEERDILVEVDIPEVSNPVAPYPLLSSSIRYHPIYASTASASSEVVFAGSDCTVVRTEGPEKIGKDALPRNHIVDVQINRSLFAMATESSLAAADSGDYAKARDVLSGALNTVKVSPSLTMGNTKSAAMMRELENTLTNVSDDHTYTKMGGRSNISETTQTWGKQRCTYGKSTDQGIYQTSLSAGMQKKGAGSKSKAFSKAFG